MPKPQRRKAPAADCPVPQSREAAAAQIAMIGALRRRIEKTKSDAEDKIAKIAEAVEEALSGPAAELAGLERGVQMFAEANRETLTGGGRVKFHDFATGRILWRLRPAKVNLRGKVEVIIERIKKLKLDGFLRVKEEIDKEAMLADPDLASSIDGVKIASAGEDFAIEPVGLEVSS